MIVVLTGASSGIGKLISEFAIKEGYRVIVNARREDPLQELKTLANDRVSVVPGDLCERNVRDQILNEAQKYGKVDYLINNAGFGWFGRLQDQEYSNLKNMYDLNVMALSDLTRLCLPLLHKSENGRILNIASVLGTMEVPYMTSYIASKYAVVGFTKALNLELADSNVSATAFCPSGIATEFSKNSMNAQAAQKFDSLSESANKVAKKIWLARDKKGNIIYPTFLACLQARSVHVFHFIFTPFLRLFVKRKGKDLLKAYQK